LIGIFPNSNLCPLVYSLPSGIVGGYLYLYTNFDDGSHPEIVTRTKLVLVPCSPAAPTTTIVTTLLFGTMRVIDANFVLLYSGYRALNILGCAASQVFSFPSLPIPSPGMPLVTLSTPEPPMPRVVTQGAGVIRFPGIVNRRGQQVSILGLSGNPLTATQGTVGAVLTPIPMPMGSNAGMVNVIVSPGIPSATMPIAFNGVPAMVGTVQNGVIVGQTGPASGVNLGPIQPDFPFGAGPGNSFMGGNPKGKEEGRGKGKGKPKFLRY
jgi:hypothetical protein